LPYIKSPTTNEIAKHLFHIKLNITPRMDWGGSVNVKKHKQLRIGYMPNFIKLYIGFLMNHIKLNLDQSEQKALVSIVNSFKQVFDDTDGLISNGTTQANWGILGKVIEGTSAIHGVDSNGNQFAIDTKSLLNKIRVVL